MTTYLNIPGFAGRGGRSCRAAFLAGLVALVLAMEVFAQAPAATGDAVPPPSSEELEKVVAPIALYPDDLVAIILPAATNPLQVVQADRYLEKRKADPKLPVDESWDGAVKSLLNYPEVIKKMSDDLDWTAALGEAVVSDQGQVLEAVQTFRRKAHSAGSLKSDDKQVVVVEKEIIKIVPANPEVIYVPQYNPTTVIYTGYSSWGYWPAPYPVYYYPYPPGAAFTVGLIWGAAIHDHWHDGHYAAHWESGGNNTINIDRSQNINIDRDSVRKDRGQGGAKVTPWKSDKKPGQVSRTVGKTPSTRVGDSRPGGISGSGMDARPSTQPAGGAGRDVAGSSGRDFGGSSGRDVGGGALDGYDSGRQTRMDSSRGASSRNSMSGGGFQRPSGGMRGGGGRRR